MKIRTDFVTNSSSSNYVIAFRDKAERGDELKRRLNKLVMLTLESVGNYESSSAERFGSVKAIENWLKDEYFGGEETIETYFDGTVTREQLEKLLDDKYAIYIKEVGYGDEATQEALKIFHELLGKDFKILSE